MTKAPELEGLDEFLLETCKKWNAPGGSIAVLKDSKVVYAKGFGYRDVANKLEWTPQTLQSIGSATKSFTATAVAMMVEDGIIEWDKPIRDYVLEFKLKDSMASNNTTFVDLLGHRTGLPGHYFALMNDGLSLDNILDRLPHLELSKPFRTSFQYCNLLYVVAAKLIEEISGMSFSKFIQKRVFKPLRMKNSVLTFAEYKQFDDHALGYRERSGKLEEIESPASMYDTSSGGGAIFSNAEDIGRWIEFHLNKGEVRGKQLIKPESLRKTYHPLYILPGSAGGLQIDKKWWYQSGYGMGWQTVVYRGELMVFHGGSWPGYCTEIRFYPDKNVGVVVYGNKDYAMPFAIFYNIIDRLLGFEPFDWNKVYKDWEDEILAGMQQMEEAKKAEVTTGLKPTRPIREFT
ncbi:MAG: serine hydrolase domain-containing protein, partial [Candidatus Thorarchaeota archaeon]